jgi:hypothetical protein
MTRRPVSSWVQLDTSVYPCLIPFPSVRRYGRDAAPACILTHTNAFMSRYLPNAQRSSAGVGWMKFSNQGGRRTQEDEGSLNQRTGGLSRRQPGHHPASGSRGVKPFMRRTRPPRAWRGRRGLASIRFKGRISNCRGTPVQHYAFDFNGGIASNSLIERMSWRSMVSANHRSGTQLLCEGSWLGTPPDRVFPRELP